MLSRPIGVLLVGNSSYLYIRGTADSSRLQRGSRGVVMLPHCGYAPSRLSTRLVMPWTAERLTSRLTIRNIYLGLIRNFWMKLTTLWICLPLTSTRRASHEARTPVLLSGDYGSVVNTAPFRHLQPNARSGPRDFIYKFQKPASRAHCSGRRH